MLLHEIHLGIGGLGNGMSSIKTIKDDYRCSKPKIIAAKNRNNLKNDSWKDQDIFYQNH